MDRLTVPALKTAIRKIHATMAASRDELNRLDGALGDGDIGITVNRGLASLLEELDQLPEDVGRALFACARAFTRTGTSSYSTLLATGMMAMGRVANRKAEVLLTDLPGMLGAAIEKMGERGRSSLGDKTVLDALDAVRVALLETPDPAGHAVAADRAVGVALDAFRTRPCRQGRARMFREKSATVDDPGMVVIKRCTEALCDTTRIEDRPLDACVNSKERRSMK